MDLAKMISIYVVWSVLSALLTWALIDMGAWGYLVAKGAPPKKKKKGVPTLSVPLGIVERTIFWIALIAKIHILIGLWLALKVTVKWSRWKEEKYRGVYNIFLIGTGLNLILSFIGAWIVLGELPV